MTFLLNRFDWMIWSNRVALRLDSPLSLTLVWLLLGVYGSEDGEEINQLMYGVVE